MNFVFAFPTAAEQAMTHFEPFFLSIHQVSLVILRNLAPVQHQYNDTVLVNCVIESFVVGDFSGGHEASEKMLILVDFGVPRNFGETENCVCRPFDNHRSQHNPNNSIDIDHHDMRHRQSEVLTCVGRLNGRLMCKCMENEPIRACIHMCVATNE